MRKFMNTTKALSDENRIRTLLALRHGELFVCQITELFGLATSTISKHLSILFQAGLLESRKQGRWIYYKSPEKDAPPAVREAIQRVSKSLDKNRRITEDRKSVEQTLEQDPTELCKLQC